MDSRIKSVTFCLFLLQSYVDIQCLECQDCMHIGYKFTNMPSLYEGLMVSLLDSFDLKNLACKSNNTRPSSCNLGGFGTVSKCVDVVVTVNAQGMKSVAPEAGMEMEVITRGCAARPRSEQDTCSHISTLGDASTQASLMQSLQRLTQRFNSVSYNGQVCYHSERSNGYKKPTTRSWYSGNSGRGSTGRTNQWQTARPTQRRNQWQRVTTDGSTSSANGVSVYEAVLFVWPLFLLKTFF